jgi:hypothetical protein
MSLSLHDQRGESSSSSALTLWAGADNDGVCVQTVVMIFSDFDIRI